MVETLNTNTLMARVLGNLMLQTDQPGSRVITTEDGQVITIDESTPGDGSTGTEGAAAATEGSLAPGGVRVEFGEGGTFSITTGGDTAGPPPGPTRWSSASPYEYNLAREYVIDVYFGGNPEGRDTTIVGSFVNAWAERLATEDENGNVAFPSYEDLVKTPLFNQGAAFLPMAGQIPESQVVMADPDENGNFSNYYRITYDPLEGLKQEAIAPETFFGSQTPGQVPATETGAGIDLEAVRAELGDEAVEQLTQATEGGFEVGQSEVANLRPEILSKLDPQTQAALTGNATITNARGQKVTVLPEVIPLTEYIQQFLKPPEPQRTRGGAPAPKIDFDRRKLKQAATDEWRRILWEDPNDGRISSLVDAYITEATGFWRNSGGRVIDYQAFLREQLEGTSRYKTIYRFKPQDVDVNDFISTMTSPIGSLGIESGAQRREQLNALQSGGSAEGQLSRVANLTSEGRAATNFSRRFAQTLRGLGAGGLT